MAIKFKLPILLLALASVYADDMMRLERKKLLFRRHPFAGALEGRATRRGQKVSLLANR